MSPLVALARFGYFARGVVYAIVGAFAVLAAIGSAQTKSTEEAVLSLLGQPFGLVLVGAVVLGLAAFAIWRLAQALLDTDDHGRGLKGVVVRAGLLVSSAVHFALALSTGAVAFGLAVRSGGDGGGGQGLMNGAVGFFGARPVATGLALIFLGVAVAHFVRAWRGSFERFFQVDEDTMRVVRPVGRIGLSARGVVFLVIAGLMGYRAYTARDMGEEPPGLTEVLQAVQSMPAGGILLGLIGIGLIAYAVYSFATGAYRTIDRRPLSLPSSRDRLIATTLSPLSGLQARRGK